MKNPVRSITALSAGVVLLLAAFSCELPPLYEVWGDFKSGELDITPSFVTLEETKSVTLTVTGGRTPYSYQNISGVGTLTPLNGHAVYEAPLGAEGDRWIRVMDAKGDVSDARILVTALPVPLLRISPTTISISTAETATFTPSGGKPDYFYFVISGAGSVDPGPGPNTTYTAPAVVTTAVVRVTDASGQVADATVYVSAGPPPLVIDPPTLQIETGGMFTFAATGGTPPYTFSATDGAIVPATGEYTAPGLPNPSVTVTVTDSTVPVAGVATAAVTVIAPPAGDPLAIVPRALTIGKFKSFQFSAVNGSPPYQYFMVSGNGSITRDGGLYTASNKVGTETVMVRDSNGAEDFATITVKAK